MKRLEMQMFLHGVLPKEDLTAARSCFASVPPDDSIASKGARRSSPLLNCSTLRPHRRRSLMGSPPLGW